MIPLKTLPHQLTQHTKLLHKVALVHGNKVLILKRSPQAGSRPGKWDLPGGNSEWPSATHSQQMNLHQQDLEREILEETGLMVEAARFTQDKLKYFATFFEPDRQLYSINCGWVLDISHDQSNSQQEPQIQLSREHTEFAWITLQELSQYDFGGVDRDYETAIIRKALRS